MVCVRLRISTSSIDLFVLSPPPLYKNLCLHEEGEMGFETSLPSSRRWVLRQEAPILQMVNVCKATTVLYISTCLLSIYWLL